MHAHNLLVWRFREVGLKQSFSLVVEEATFDLSNPEKVEDFSLGQAAPTVQNCC
jgi:hypothetical protein